jgi:hypothetical protein
LYRRMGVEKLALTGIWSLDRPASSMLLYQLHCTGILFINCAFSFRNLTRKHSLYLLRMSQQPQMKLLYLIHCVFQRYRKGKDTPAEVTMGDIGIPSQLGYKGKSRVRECLSVQSMYF